MRRSRRHRSRKTEGGACDSDGKACASKVERAGEDPSNDEGVRVVLTFDCPSRNVIHDAGKFLAAQGARAWQVVTILRGDAHRQVLVNAESPPAPMIAP